MKLSSCHSKHVAFLSAQMDLKTTKLIVSRKVEVAAEAKATIETKTQALLSPQDVDDEEDSFADIDFTIDEDVRK